MSGIVKPLDWEDFDGQGAKANAMLIASYLITRWSTGEFEVSVSCPGYSTVFDGDKFYPTLEAAKAAAQADYEARILSSLTADPNALVAAALERAADIVACQCQCMPVSLDKKIRAMVSEGHLAALEAVRAEARAEEREACAKIERDLAKSMAHFVTRDEWKGYMAGVVDYLAAIRARGESDE